MITYFFIEKSASNELSNWLGGNDFSKIIANGKDIINKLKDSDTLLCEKFLKEVELLEKIDQDFILAIPSSIDVILNFYRNFISMN